MWAGANFFYLTYLYTIVTKNVAILPEIGMPIKEKTFLSILSRKGSVDVVWVWEFQNWFVMHSLLEELFVYFFLKQEQ